MPFIFRENPKPVSARPSRARLDGSGMLVGSGVGGFGVVGGFGTLAVSLKINVAPREKLNELNREL